MATDSYALGSHYESFMRRAFPLKGTNSAGMNLAEMRNLIDAENGENWVKHLPSAAKQLVKVKGYIDKALASLIKSSRDPYLKEQFGLLRGEAAASTYSYGLNVVIGKAMELILGPSPE